MSIFSRQRKQPSANYVSPAAAMYPTGLLDREIAEAYMLGVASRKAK